MDNIACDFETPGKKRKRNEDLYCKLQPERSKNYDKVLCELNGALDNRALNLKVQSDKIYTFNSDMFMEVKSIQKLPTENPYEVIRKPPIKKKKYNIQDNCFVNPALNLNVVEENYINPFEVKRSEISCSPRLEKENHCFINPCLSIRGPETQTNYNPFEVFREKEQGFENPGLDLPTLSIALPFTPTLGRRINFNDIQGNPITPSEMLAKTLVFSPEKALTPKRNLSIISEEAVDIDEELDSYQLQLENSINEAKNNKKKNVKRSVNIKHISNLSKNLSNLHEINENEEFSEINVENIQENSHIESVQDTCQIDLKINNILENSDVVFEEINESIGDDDIKPIPFKRTFCRSIKVKQQNPQEKITDKRNESIKDKLRKSFRKLVHIQNNNEPNECETIGNGGFISTIRQSFRRKKTIVSSSILPKQENIGDISIINEDIRKIFREPENDCIIQRTTFRRSLRKSVKRHMIKSVLKTNDNYQLD